MEKKFNRFVSSCLMILVLCLLGRSINACDSCTSAERMTFSAKPACPVCSSLDKNTSCIDLLAPVTCAQCGHVYTEEELQKEERVTLWQCTATAKGEYSPEFSALPKVLVSSWKNSRHEAKGDVLRQIFTLIGLTPPDDINPADTWVANGFEDAFNVTYQSREE